MSGLNANASSFQPGWAAKKTETPAPPAQSNGGGGGGGGGYQPNHRHAQQQQQSYQGGGGASQGGYGGGNPTAAPFVPGGGGYAGHQQHHHHQYNAHGGHHQQQYGGGAGSYGGGPFGGPSGHHHHHHNQNFGGGGGGHHNMHHHGGHHHNTQQHTPQAPIPSVTIGGGHHQHHHGQQQQRQPQQHTHHQYQQHGHHHHHQHQQQQQQQPKKFVPPPKPTEFAPQPQNTLHPHQEVVKGSQGIKAAPSRLKNLPVFVFLGPRGAGKSTQAKLVAEKYNYLYVASGDIVRSGKLPYIELGEIIKKEVVENVNNKNYKGLALDRFLATGQNDMYFLDHCLGQYNMQIDLVFVLMMDHDVAQARVDAREEGDAAKKPKSYQRRMMEHRAIYETSTNLFEPLGKLRAVDCDDKELDDIARSIHVEVNEYLTKGTHTEPLPPSFLKDNKSLQLVPDFARTHQVKQDIVKTLEMDARFADAFPGSLMTGVMDHRKFEEKARHLHSYYATAKADGQRVLVVKHELGLYLFPSSYQAMYEVVPAPPQAVKEPKQLGQTSGMSMTSPISYIVDAEVITPEEGKKLAIYAFDFVFFFGLRGSKVTFGQRYEMISDYFGVNNTWGTFHAKKCVPIAQLGELMPEYGEGMPFPIDGVILQHNAFYKVPLDANVFKWKPREMCTVDFRLCDGVEDEDNNQWKFGGKVSLKNAEGAADEHTFPDTLIVIPTDIVVNDNLADGTVVECIKTDRKVEKKIEIWEYHRSRPDKLTPNRKDIAEYTSKMDHMSFAQLKQRCALVGKK